MISPPCSKPVLRSPSLLLLRLFRGFSSASFLYKTSFLFSFDERPFWWDFLLGSTKLDDPVLLWASSFKYFSKSRLLLLLKQSNQNLTITACAKFTALHTRVRNMQVCRIIARPAKYSPPPMIVKSVWRGFILFFYLVGDYKGKDLSVLLKEQGWSFFLTLTLKIFGNLPPPWKLTDATILVTTSSKPTISISDNSHLRTWK